MSKPSRLAIYNVLSRRYARVGISLIDNVADLHDLVAKKPDLVFLGSKFVPRNPSLGLDDENRVWLSSYLEDNDIAHTGSASVAHELDCDKTLAKQAVRTAGLQTSPFYIARQHTPLTQAAVTAPYPLFVKPANRGGGLGIGSDSVVYDFAALQAKVTSIAHQHGSDSLIERYLPGREFSVAVMREYRSDELSIMPVELIAEADKRGHRVLGAAAKSANNEQVIPVTDQSVRHRVSQLALGAFHALGARDYGRVDIRLDADGTPHFLEANLIPSLIGGYGTFPKACQLYMGMDYEAVIYNLVDLAMERAVNDRESTFVFGQGSNADMQAIPSL